MKKLLILLMVFLILPIYAAAQTLVFEGFLFSGESVNVEDQSVLVHVDTSGKKVVFDYGTGILSVRNNTCDSTLSLKFCVDQTEWVQKTDRWKADVRVFSLVPEITISRTISDADVRVGEETEVSVTITNTGPIDATNAVYTDSFPDYIEIVRVDGVLIEGNVVVWRGKISHGGSEAFTYTIKTKSKVREDSYIASLNYFNGFKFKTLYTSAITLKATPFFDITSVLQKDSILAGEEINITINLTNFNAKTVDVDFEFRVGDGLEVVNYRSIIEKVDDKTFRWAGPVRENRSQQLRFFLKGVQLTPAAEIFFKAKYTDYFRVERKTDEVKKKIKIEDKGVKLSTNIDDFTIEAFQSKRIKAWVQNLNPYVAIKNVIVKVSGDFTELEDIIKLDTIKKGERISVLDKTFYAKNVSATKGGLLFLNVSYENELGGKYSKELKTTLTVRPLRDIVITQDIGKTALESDETTTVSVKLDNPRLTDIKGVTVSDTSSNELVKTGAASNVVNIPREDLLTVYTYTIKAPNVKVEKSYNITTNVQFIQTLQNETSIIPVFYTNSKTSTITVKPKKLVLTTVKQLPNPDVFIGEPFEVEYVISNPSSSGLVAKNIRIVPRPQREFDLVDPTLPVVVPDLNPGELVTLSVRELNRPKFNTTQTLRASLVTYLDENNNEWSVNTSSIDINVQTKPLGSAPFIVLTKQAPGVVNDTDEFEVWLNATNIGRISTKVRLVDGQNKWDFSLGSNEQKIISYKQKITSTGIVELEAAQANYSDKSRTYLTGSDRPVVNVVQNPLVSIAQEFPETVNNIDSFTVKVRVKSLKPVFSLRIVSGNNSWELQSLEGEKEFSYEKNLADIGQTALEQAEVTYSFEGAEYSTKSETGKVSVIEKQVITLQKAASALVEQGREFKVKLAVKNNEKEPVYGIELVDEGKKWVVDLEPGEEKSFSYAKVLDVLERVELEPAKATYAFREKTFTAVSSELEVSVTRPKGPPIEGILKVEEKPKGAVNLIIYYLKKVLTFKIWG